MLTRLHYTRYIFYGQHYAKGMEENEDMRNREKNETKRNEMYGLRRRNWAQCWIKIFNVLHFSIPFYCPGLSF